jgi:uncharacterized membrane protein YphA (DoxX/SURF4 family)
METNVKSSKVIKLMLLPRLSLALIYSYLGFKHLFTPESFRSTIALPESGGNIIREIFALPLENETFFLVFRYFAVGIELLMGFMLLTGFLLRLCGIISSSLTFLLAISLIPNLFLFVLHAIPFLLSLPLIFINSNLFSPAERFIPESLLILQKR